MQIIDVSGVDNKDTVHSLLLTGLMISQAMQAIYTFYQYCAPFLSRWVAQIKSICLTQRMFHLWAVLFSAQLNMEQVRHIFIVFESLEVFKVGSKCFHIGGQLATF